MTNGLCDFFAPKVSPSGEWLIYQMWISCWTFDIPKAKHPLFKGQPNSPAPTALYKLEKKPSIHDSRMVNTCCHEANLDTVPSSIKVKYPSTVASWFASQSDAKWNVLIWIPMNRHPSIDSPLVSSNNQAWLFECPQLYSSPLTGSN